ncbi:MAG: glycosyltransferase [Lewinella sp.]
MLQISLLSIVRGRRRQLHNLLLGIAAQRLKPAEVIIVFMNEEVPDRLPDPGCKLYLHRLTNPKHPLPLAAARNQAAARAKGDMLAFLDVDCIPDPDYLQRLAPAVNKTNGIVMGDVHYLPKGSTGENWTFDSLAGEAVRHPRRPEIPTDKEIIPLPYQLFWSLSFGLRRREFERLGGFDETYGGYGGEDTDFSFTARKTGVPLYACDARAYHQYHLTYSPPYNHLEDIVANANRFYEKWQVWPMEGWLRKFEDDGYILWDTESIRLLRPADEQTITAVRSESPYG